MIQKTKRTLKLLLFISTVAAVLIISAGFDRNLSAGNDETYKGLKLFSDVIDEIEKNYVDEVDTEDLVHKAIQGMVHSLDPHSSFLPPEAFDELQVDTKGEFGGIGIVITMKQGVLTVISPIEGTPAHKAGIKAEDIIVKVNDESTKDMMLWEAVKKMRGPKGKKVKITILRKGESEPLEFDLVRDVIPLESVKYMVLKPGYGYIWVTNFRDNTLDDIIEALKNLESGDEPLKGLVFDLRGNPGGLLNQAVSISDLFLEKGDIVSIKGRKKSHTELFKAHPNDTPRDYPIVVLINGGSASASEIVAGALQDHKRALILGTTSFGKGSVQTVKPLKDGYGLKYTIALYYTPNGRSIQAQGIVPDIIVKHHILSEETNEESHFLKEKDLKNHLEAFPEKQEKEDESNENNSTDKDKKSEKPRHGELKLEDLMADNQVSRALDILISYDIFKQMNGK